MTKLDLSKAVAKLVSTANTTSVRELVKKELDSVIDSLKSKEDARNSQRNKISDQTYPDTLSDFSKSLKKNIGDLLMPAFDEEAKIINSDLNLAQTFIEIYCSMQLDIMRAMRRLDEEVQTIKRNSEVPIKVGNEEIILTEDGQQAIGKEIVRRIEKLESLQTMLKELSIDIIDNIIKKAMFSSKLKTNKIKSEGLQELLVSFKSKDLSPYQKTFDQSIMQSLDVEIDELNARKRLLKTSPELLGKEILDLQANGKPEEAIEKLKALTLLSRGTSVGLLPESVSRYVITPISQVTLNQLGRQEKAHQGSILYFQKNSEYKLSNIAKTAAGIASCLSLLNEVELIREQILEAKSIAEYNNDLKTLATLRRNLLDLEPLTLSLNQLSDEYYAYIVSELEYVVTNLDLQGVEQYLSSQTSIAISQMESNIKVGILSPSIEESIQKIGFSTVSVQEHYQLEEGLDLLEEEILGPNANQGMNDDLFGEQYEIRPENNPTDGPAIKIVDDIATMNPNSFGDILPTIEEPKPVVKTAEEELQEITAGKPIAKIPMPSAIPWANIYSKRTDNLSSKPALTKPKSGFEEARAALYSSRTGSISPFSGGINQTPTAETLEGLEPVPVATVVTLERSKEESKAESTDRYVPYKERTGNVSPLRIGRDASVVGQRLSPYSRPISSKPVKITGALLTKACEAISQRYNLPEGAETIGGLRVK